METNVRNKNWIKAYIVDVLPCITMAIYILAIIFNIAYYSVFNINILHYLSFSDMLLSILDTLVVFAFLSLFIIWYTLFFFTTYIAEERLNKSIKERKVKHLYRFVPIKCLRLYIKIMNSKIGKKFIEYKKKLNENEKKRREEQEKNPYYHSWIEFTRASLIMVFSYFIYLDGIEKGSDKGMSGASMALIYPVFIYCFIPLFLNMTKYVFGLSGMRYMRFLQYKSIEFLEIILVYYIYAVIIFYKSGIVSGEYYKNNDLVEFNIKTSDGTEFNDSTYRFVNILNERVFLFEKSTKKNLILTNEGIAYIKVNFKDASAQSAIVRIINKEENELAKMGILKQ